MSVQEASSNELFEAILSIPDENVVTNFMSYNEAAAEAERVGTFCKQFNAILRNTGIESISLDRLAKRIGAFVWSAAVGESLLATETTAEKEWTIRKPAGVEVRRLLIRDFLYAFRKNPELLESVQQIIDGKGNRDLLLYIISCSKLCKGNISLLNKSMQMLLFLIKQLHSIRSYRISL